MQLILPGLPVWPAPALGWPLSCRRAGCCWGAGSQVHAACAVAVLLGGVLSLCTAQLRQSGWSILLMQAIRWQQLFCRTSMLLKPAAKRQQAMSKDMG